MANPPSALAGVLAPGGSGLAAGARERLSAALQPDGPSQRFDDGPLSVAWTEGVHLRPPARAETLCLCDGNVYNAAEVARDLEMPEDTEPVALLAAGYERWGTGLLPRLRGDFAVVFWNPAAQRGAIARDQLGGRPLFLRTVGDQILFASELRNLLVLQPSTPDPDEVAVASWLGAGAITDNRTLYEGLEALEPGTYVELGPTSTSLKPTSYWQPEFKPRSGLGSAEASELVRPALERAVALRAGPGQSSAVLLSGGIDSASVAGIATTLEDEKQPTRSYSAVFPAHPQIDEAPLISSIAAHCRLRATGLSLESGGLLGGALPFLDAWGVPPTTPNLFFLYPLLGRAAADGVRVMLDGEGGDAIFWYTATLLSDRLRRGRLLSAWSLAGRFPEYGGTTTARTRLNQLRQWGRRRDLSPPPPGWLTLEPPEPLRPPAGESGAPPWWHARVQGILGPGSRILHDTSRRHGALTGIEPRHPLLDVDLIELALSLPPELAFDRRYNRPVLRHAVAGLVPDEARLRPYKSNFDPVFVDGVVADLPAIRELLLDPGAETRRYADREALEARMGALPSEPGARREWARELWQLTTLECWLRRLGGGDLVPGRARSLLPPAVYEFTPL
jgi:asparagine synthase (glutamine-hydrolysing)